MLAIPLLAIVLAPQGQGSSNAPVVVNEFSYDDTLTDDLEFVELFNRTRSPVDIGNWTVVSEDPVGLNFVEVIPAGTTLAPGDFWVLGDPGVPNLDQPFRATTSMENSEESLTLVDHNGRTVDTLVYEANKGVWNATLAEGEGIWGNAAMTENAGSHSWSRVRDGYDTDNNGHDFRQQPWTPGRSNDLPPLGVDDDFDALAPGAAVPGWSGSFAPMRAVDPTTPDALNPSAIPLSPQGGNAAVVWDESGGGDHVTLLSAASIETSVEGWVFLDPTIENTLSDGSSEHESWSLGIQGTSGTFYNTPDPAGSFSPPFVQNGNTGISWTYLANDQNVTLFLIDHDDGGWGTGAATAPSVLAAIPIQAGINDGWQRLLLDVTGNTLTARFGGTPGRPDGQLFTATVAPELGGVYVGYREFVLDQSTLRPFTVDALTVRSCTSAGLGFFGRATPNTVAVPTIDHSGLPTVGGAIAVTGAGNLPNTAAFVALGFVLPAPIDLGLFGGVPGSRLYLNILIAATVATDGAGNLSHGFPIPADRGVCGVVLGWQTLQADFGLGVTLPLAHSQGMTTTVGL